MNTRPQRVSPAPEASDTANVLSYYRRHARQCAIAAQNSPNPKQRAELQKMVRVWSEFAIAHEQLIRGPEEEESGQA